MLRIDFNLVLTIINLIVLYLILRKFLFRPVMDIMEKREKMIADGISHANEEQDKAHALKKQYEDALNGAKRRIHKDDRTGETGCKTGIQPDPERG